MMIDFTDNQQFKEYARDYAKAAEVKADAEKTMEWCKAHMIRMAGGEDATCKHLDLIVDLTGQHYTIKIKEESEE